MEQRSRDAFQGVAMVDEVAEDPTVRAVKLVAGDAAAILLFAAIGRGNHGGGTYLPDLTIIPPLILSKAFSNCQYSKLKLNFFNGAVLIFYPSLTHTRPGPSHPPRPNDECRCECKSLNHGDGFAVGDVLATALPFLIGWFATSPLTGTFGEDAKGTKLGPAAAAAAKGWAVGVPAGLVLRSVGKGALPPQPFVIVTMAGGGGGCKGWVVYT